MKSFRSEIENPVVQQDIIELEKRIREFKEGKADEEKFRSLRLARGVYGQRQAGVQMVRIKLPYGKVTSRQLRRIADVADKYSNGNLHITTRQDIQIHYVDLERTPELWAELERDAVTLREACGNTVRNVTASETAGIDRDEAFDVSPYAQAVFEYFLRNPVGQEMGRKFKVSFSGGASDTGLSYMHDLGFIARVQQGKRGFRVMVGGGLGAQPRHADQLYDFLETDRIIPLMEQVVRVFDRYGERKSRAKARMKFLLKDIGLDRFRQLLEEERSALPFPLYPIQALEAEVPLAELAAHVPRRTGSKVYRLWKRTNVFEQKQPGFRAIGIRVPLGNFNSTQARKLADLVEHYAGAEIRLSLRQNILIPYVPEANLGFFHQELLEMGLAHPGYNKALDITACPGTDTCNLGIASSTGIARKLEEVLQEEYPEYLENQDLLIKISGCMNACGQHTMAHIGFQGMSLRTPDKRVAPALQVLLGGINLGGGNGRFADKVVKIPSKRGPEALRKLLNDYAEHGGSLPFHEYYQQQGQIYFYELLKPLTDSSNLVDEDFIDWGSRERYEKAIGIGECAGTIIDLVATLFFESEEKLQQAEEQYVQGKFAAAIYFTYSAYIHAAKALLTAAGEKTNTHAGIIKDLDRVFVQPGKLRMDGSFSREVLRIQQVAPSSNFALAYRSGATKFLSLAKDYREKELSKTTA